MRDNILKRWSGITDQYNQFRPIVPLHLIETLKRMSQKDELMCVVDLGSGTGHATRAWAEHAHEVLGVEPALEMLLTAQKNTPQKNISFIHGYGNKTTLKNQSVDIVSAASSIHWMEPESTLKEVIRILKKDGLFTFFGPSHPPVTPFLKLDQLYFELADKITRFKSGLPIAERWSWNEIVGHINKENLFVYQRYFYTHQELHWSAEDYINWLKTTNELHALLNLKDPELLKYVDHFAESIRYHFGSEQHPCFFVYKTYVYKDKSGTKST